MNSRFGKVLQMFLLLFVLVIQAPSYQASCSTQCKNGGTCFKSPSANTTQCSCPPTHTGQFCENVNSCYNHSCLNGAVCAPGTTTTNYSCQCLPGYTGSFCHTEIKYCSSLPCVHGMCTERVTDFQCDCLPGYTGTLCDSYISLCGDNPCGQLDATASCQKEDVGYSCQCSSDEYFGLNCENNVENCDEQEESYCLCEINHLPVKFKLPTPESYSGVNTRDVLSALIGVSLGFLLGLLALLLYKCCFSAGTASFAKRTPYAWSRPSTRSSVPSSWSSVSTNKIHPYVGSPRNVYRAGFGDDLNPRVSEPKSHYSYDDSASDWTKS